MIGGAGFLALGLAVRVARRIPAVDRFLAEVDDWRNAVNVTPAMLEGLNEAIREQGAAMGLEVDR